VPGYAAGMVGVVLIVIAMVVVGPFALFVGGAIWSALVGQLLTGDAEERYAGTEYTDQRLW
jgi:hypothetical protein